MLIERWYKKCICGESVLEPGSVPPGKVVARFPAFHQWVTPELDGKISAVSPSSVVDEKTGAAFYRVKLEISDGELARLKDKSLVPGMPVEAFFQRLKERF